jgi:hypothetical protein
MSTDKLGDAMVRMNREADAEMIERIINRLRMAGILSGLDADDCRSILWAEITGTAPFSPEDPATEDEPAPAPLLPRSNVRPLRKTEASDVLGIAQAFGEGLREHRPHLVDMVGTEPDGEAS